MLGLFVWPAPMTLKQIYLTITGVIVAFVFTWTPEWTTWTLLIAMAIYDMFAVLMPGGPLKVWRCVRVSSRFVCWADPSLCGRRQLP